MSDLSRLVSGIVNVIDVFWLIQFPLSKPHPFHKVQMYEVVGGSGVHQCFDIGHIVTCSNGHWNSHRTETHHIQSYNVEPLPRPSGSGIEKILISSDEIP
jgi:hypothetical protein